MFCVSLLALLYRATEIATFEFDKLFFVHLAFKFFLTGLSSSIINHHNLLSLYSFYIYIPSEKQRNCFMSASYIVLVEAN
jgi:hypothetical protein